MANIKKCDRCGEVYKENNIMCKIGVMNKDVSLSGLELVNKEGYIIEASYMDLCDNCLHDLLMWLRNDGHFLSNLSAD